jgi:hypothetical protein
MLAGQDLGGHHQSRLTAAFGHPQGSQQGHQGLAAAHVALEQPVEPGVIQIGVYLQGGGLLIVGELEGQPLQENLLQRGKAGFASGGFAWPVCTDSPPAPAAPVFPFPPLLQKQLLQLGIR